jgi:hypothetical protein
MTLSGIGAIVFFVLMLAMYGVLLRRLRRRRIGPATVGMFYDMLQDDKRKAVEIVVGQKAEKQDPETPDGILTDREAVKSHRPGISN